MYQSPAGDTYFGMRIATRNTDAMMFRVHACGEVDLALSAIPAIVTERTFQGTPKHANMFQALLVSKQQGSLGMSFIFYQSIKVVIFILIF